MPIPYVSFPEFTRSTLPEPISFKDQQVIIVDPDGTRALLFSNGKVWVSPSGANAFSELADKTTAQIATDNTSVATALAARATTVALNAHTGNVANPHGLTKAQIGLSNADNTSDAAKPISAATQVAINSLVATTGDVTAAGVQNITGAKTFSSGALKTAGATSGVTTLQSALVASGVLTLPAATDTLVARDTVDTLTNKTLTSPAIASIISGAGTLSLPSVTDTLVGRATVDTLSNKTLVAPVMSGLPTAPTASQGSNSSQIATTAYADTLGATKANANNPAFTGTPTGLTKTHIGLSNADNTSDTNKPISTLQAAAFAAKADANNPAFTGTPTGLTKAHVGLSNADNTSDVSKPISTLQAAALAGKQATLSAGSNIIIVGNTISSTGSGSGSSARIAFAPAVPLDTIGEGKSMPIIVSDTIPINSPTTFTIAAGVVDGGVCEMYLAVNAAVTLPTTYPGIPAGRGVAVTGFITAGFNYRIVFAISAGDLVIFCFQQSALVAAPVFSAQTPPPGTIGTAYSYTYVAPSATSFAVGSGTLPTGLSLTPSTGVLAGTPTTAATSSFVISATGAGGTTSSTAQSVVISAVVVNQRFSTLQLGMSESGTGPYSYSNSTNTNGASFVSNLKFPAGVAASLTYKCTAIGTSGAYLSFMLDTENTTAGSGAEPISIKGYGGGSSGGTWYAHTTVDAAGIVSQTTNTFVRLRRSASNVLYAEESFDNITWLTIASISGSNVDYWPKFTSNPTTFSTLTMQAFSQTGMV